MTADLDLNLLKVFDALVEAGSVTGAADRLHLSVPATSRALGRLRRGMGDPIFVRSGRGLAPTPFAVRAAPQVRALLESAHALLVDEASFDPARLERAFTIRGNDAVAAVLAPVLLGRVGAEAPGVELRLLGEGAEDVQALRNADVDLDIGAIAPTPPDVRVEALYDERLVAVVAASSALGRSRRPTLSQLCRYPHVSSSRRGRARGPLDDVLAEAGLVRRVPVVVASPVSAVLLAADADAVALVPQRLASSMAERLAVRWFPLPVDLPTVTIAMQWHARLDNDPGHRWLRAQVHASVGRQQPDGSAPDGLAHRRRVRSPEL